MNYRFPRPSAARVLAPLAACALAAGLASGHDEDWRKLLDKLPAVEGDVWRLGDPVLRDGTFDSLGVTCLAHFPVNTFGLGSTEGNDCWGYTSPSGREYAIMGLSNGWGYVEITDPINSTIIDTVPGPQSGWHDVKVVGTYAYGVSEGGSGVQVMDLSDIDNGNVTLVGNIQNGGHSTTHNIVANEEAGTLWICGANIGNGGLVHMDISNPTNPTPSGGFTSDGYTHDAQVVSYNGPDADYIGREIAFLANEDTVTIADVTNPAATTQIARRSYSSTGYTHQCWLSEDRQYLYMNDELDEQFGLVSTTTTRVFDVSNLDNPVLVNTFTTGLPSIDHNLYVKDGYIYMANYRTGLRVFDATSNPTNPTEIAFFDTFPGSDSDSFNGAWSVYPYFDSGTVIVSDIERGLFVLRVDAIDLDRLDLALAGEAPELIDPDGGETLTITVDEINLAANPSTATLVYDDGTGPVNVAGSPGAGANEYDFVFPAGECGNEASYYVSIESTTGETFTLPGNAPAGTFTATIVDSIDTVFTEDFESAPGWTVTGVSGQGVGEWELGVPNGDGSRGDAPTDFDGSGQCYLTGNGGPGSNTDVDGGATVLTSPAFDASGIPEALISYARWYDNTGSGTGGNPGVETMEIEISGNNGASWVALETVGPTGGESSGGWFVATHRIADYVTPSAQVRLRFNVSDDIGAVIEAAVDAIEISSLVCDPAPVCPADIDGDGDADADDINDFVVAFTDAVDGNADIDNDGDEDADDINAFVTAFVAGCD